MPTVTYTCPESGKKKTKKFAYTGVGKAQAHEFAGLMKGSMKNNPNYGMETKSYGY